MYNIPILKIKIKHFHEEHEILFVISLSKCIKKLLNASKYHEECLSQVYNNEEFFAYKSSFRRFN